MAIRASIPAAVTATAAPSATYSRPSLSLLGTEPWRAATEFIALKVRHRPHGPRGDGHPVIFFPGLASDGHALAPLREHCRALGYAAFDWGRGWNTGPQGDLDAWMASLADDVDRIATEVGEAPSLIGWSLGGVYARELAKLPHLRVRRVITIGTPFDGDADQTHAGWVYRMLNGAPATLDAALRERMRTPPPVPTTSIYSRSDGIVAWQSCVHRRSHPGVEDVEVDGSHLGMGWNARVLEIVADRLAQPVGDAGAPVARGAARSAGRGKSVLNASKRAAADGPARLGSRIAAMGT